jgi:hypothetical protein
VAEPEDGRVCENEKKGAAEVERWRCSIRWQSCLRMVGDLRKGEEATRMSFRVSEEVGVCPKEFLMRT